MRPLLVAFACLATTGFAGAFTLAVLDKDYSSLPDPKRPVMAQAALEGAHTGLAQAIAEAEKATSGRAASAIFRWDATPPVIEVEAFAQGVQHTIAIDPSSGRVLSDQTQPAYVLPGAPVSGEATKTASGLSYYEITPGTGEQPAGPSTRVEVHYSGWLVDGTKFDSSVDRGQPAQFALSQVIKGWTEGVGSMKVGGKRKLIIPYQLAYGAGGRAPTIPAKAMLVFDVELLRIVK